MAFVRKLAADTSGTSAVEYGLICSLIVIGLVTGIQGLGASATASFENTGNALSSANAG